MRDDQSLMRSIYSAM